MDEVGGLKLARKWTKREGKVRTGCLLSLNHRGSDLTFQVRCLGCKVRAAPGSQEST
jgi:hypothetical protein